MWYLIHDPDDYKESHIITEFVNDRPTSTTRWLGSIDECVPAPIVKSNASGTFNEYTRSYNILQSAETFEELKLLILLED